MSNTNLGKSYYLVWRMYESPKMSRRYCGWSDIEMILTRRVNRAKSAKAQRVLRGMLNEARLHLVTF
jgi:hypothetical protein